MLKVKCPNCGSVKISRINPDVIVYEHICLEERTDFYIEGGEEKPYRYMQMLADEDVPPYIEEKNSEDLEFICDDCQFKFEDCRTDADFLQRAQEWGLIVWCAE
jgi:hypothetical protein